jgi:hypothetical protein
MEGRACIGSRNRIPGSDRVIAVALRSLVPQELYYYSTTTTYEFNWALFMAIIIHLKVGSQRAAHKIPRTASSLVSERDRVLHRLACSWSLSLSVCVCGAHGRCQRNPPAAAGEEIRRVGPWMCAPSLPCMCTRQLLGLDSIRNIGIFRTILIP